MGVVNKQKCHVQHRSWMIAMRTPKNQEIGAQPDTCKYKVVYIILMVASV